MDALLDTTTPSVASCPASPGGIPLRRLYSGLSQELCRPLISLRAGCDLLLAGCEGPMSIDQRGHVRALRSSCDNMLRLTRDYLLDYAGLAQAPGPIHWAEFRLGALLQESDRQFEALARARGIAWSCRVEGGDGQVATDLGCFQRILSRLIENALAHTPEGGRVAVVGRIAASGSGWRVEVEDDGRGIPPEALQLVQQPLVRLAGTLNDPAEAAGHGLGLAVCRELVAQLGGAFVLESRPDAGTSATVTFPHATGPGSADALGASRVAGPTN